MFKKNLVVYSLTHKLRSGLLKLYFDQEKGLTLQPIEIKLKRGQLKLYPILKILVSTPNN
jgi:hypothetical protein